MRRIQVLYNLLFINLYWGISTKAATSLEMAEELASEMNKRYNFGAVPHPFAMKVAETKCATYEFGKNLSQQRVPQVDSPTFARIIVFPVQVAEYQVTSFLNKFQAFMENTVSGFANPKTCLGLGFTIKTVVLPKYNYTTYVGFMVFILDESFMLYLRRKINIVLDVEGLLQVSEYARSGVLQKYKNMTTDSHPRVELPVDDSEAEAVILSLQRQMEKKLPNYASKSVAVSIWRPSKAQVSDSDKPYIAVIYGYQSSIPGDKFVLPMKFENMELVAENFTVASLITPPVIQNMLECLYKVRGATHDDYDQFVKFRYDNRAQKLAVQTGNNPPDLPGNQPDPYHGVMTYENVNLSTPLEVLFQNIQTKYKNCFARKTSAVGLYVNEHLTAYLDYRIK